MTGPSTASAGAQARVVAASQPCFFPWVGMLELVRLADVYVHVTHVQYVKGFANRVQVKHSGGSHWLTVPVRRNGRDQLIRDTEIDDAKPWRARAMATLRNFYAQAPFRDEMLALAEPVIHLQTNRLAELDIASMHALLDYFEIETPVYDSSTMVITGAKTDMVRSLVAAVGGTCYVTAHGALDYLDHERFESEGVCVKYIDYQKREYPQQHGPFTPYVSALDLVANMGKTGRDFIASPAVPWRDMLARGSAP